MKRPVVGATTAGIPVSFPWRALAAVSFGLLLARWSWILFAPHSVSVFPSRPEAAANAAEGLFGDAGNAAATVAAQQHNALGNVRLLGVFSGQHGFAVFQLDGQAQHGVALGEEVVPGNKLVEVAADHVLIEHNGTRQQVRLENMAGDTNGLTVQPASSELTAEQAAAEWKQVQQTMQQRASKKSH